MCARCKRIREAEVRPSLGAGIFMWKAGSIDFDDLTPQKKDQVRACNSSEELIALAKKEGYELTASRLRASQVAGAVTAIATTASTTMSVVATDCPAG